MADAGLVTQVMDLLPDSAEWNEEKVGEYLDQTDGTVSKTLRSYWQMIAAKTYALLDVNEASSSRALSTVYEHAMRMADYWDAQVATDKEDAKRTTLGKISRV